jgi:hypothetical protein
MFTMIHKLAIMCFLKHSLGIALYIVRSFQSNSIYAVPERI